MLMGRARTLGGAASLRPTSDKRRGALPRQADEWKVGSVPPGGKAAGMGKREQRRALGRRGITIVRKTDRGEQILKDPDKYFAEARERARAQVERDMERERLTRA